MRVLICGCGKITKQLMKRLALTWDITLVDVSEQKLKELSSRFENIEGTVVGDAASPVLLDQIGVSEFEYVLSLTHNDKVNLAVMEHASRQGVAHLLAMVNEQSNLQVFEKLGARTLLGDTLLAKTIYHYLEDPRLNVTPLALSEGEVMEVDVSHFFRMIGKKASTVMEEGWRLAAIFRQRELIFPSPETVIEPEDRLVIVGRYNIFGPVCDLLDCGQPHFPLAYGQGLIIGLPAWSDSDAIVSEGMHLAQNTRIKHVTVLCSHENRDIEELLDPWSPTFDIRLKRYEGELLQELKTLVAEGGFGLVIIPPLEKPVLKWLSKPRLVSFSHDLPCPLLVCRHTLPYKHILVPFTGSTSDELALEVAIDLSRQLDSRIAVAVVEEPEVILGPKKAGRVTSILERVRELSHIHKINLEEIRKKGNPVKEIVEQAHDFDLMIVSSLTGKKLFFSPHVSELLARGAPCSVLIVTN